MDVLRECVLPDDQRCQQTEKIGICYDAFENVVYTDECTVQLETHRHYCCHKEGEAPRLKPRYV